MSLLVSIVYKEFSIHILKENSSWLSTEPLKNSLRQIDISSDGIIRKILALSPVCLMIELIKIFIAPDISFTRDCSFWRLPQLKKGHKMLFLYSNLDKYHSFSVIFCNCLYVSVGYLHSRPEPDASWPEMIVTNFSGFMTLMVHRLHF